MPVVRSAVASGDTTINVLVANNLPANGGVVTIDSENIQYGAATDTQLLSCTRGVNGTSAASHLVGAQVTLTESFPFYPNRAPAPIQAFENPQLGLTDPTAVPTAAQLDGVKHLNVLLDASGANQTWTLLAPTDNTLPRELYITFKTTAAKTLSVNGTSIATGTGQLFVWDVLNAGWVVA